VNEDLGVEVPVGTRTVPGVLETYQPDSFRDFNAHRQGARDGKEGPWDFAYTLACMDDYGLAISFERNLIHAAIGCPKVNQGSMAGGAGQGVPGGEHYFLYMLVAV